MLTILLPVVNGEMSLFLKEMFPIHPEIQKVNNTLGHTHTTNFEPEIPANWALMKDHRKCNPTISRGRHIAHPWSKLSNGRNFTWQ